MTPRDILKQQKLLSPLLQFSARKPQRFPVVQGRAGPKPSLSPIDQSIGSQLFPEVSTLQNAFFSPPNTAALTAADLTLKEAT